MKTIKGNKTQLLKEYNNFCNDLQLVKSYRISIKFFINKYIENEIQKNGLFYNDFFKTTNIESIKNELYKILENEYIK